MNRNIFIAYLLVFCRHSWFWLGIWVLYYLRYTDYAGIGIIETVFFFTITLSEIPTGAIADLLGKRKTLVVSFFLQALGIGFLAAAPSLISILVGATVAGVGSSLYSGTLEALVYDSLKQGGKEEKYRNIIANINTISLLAPAVCGLVGGILYTTQPNLPFLLNAGFYVAATILSYFLVEPHIDSEKFSLKNFIPQTKVGLHELFKTNAIVNQTILLLSVGLVVVICDEMLNAFLGVEYGFNANQLAILWSVIYIASALASQLTPYLKFLSHQKFVVGIGIIMAVSLLLSPIIGMWIGAFMLLLRSCLQALFYNESSIVINQQTESKNRATTLSTFNLMKNIPYVLLAYGMGSLAQSYSAVRLAIYLGLALSALIVLQLFRQREWGNGEAAGNS